MRIALFCPSYGQVGGIEAKADRLIAACGAAGHEVTVIARGQRGRVPSGSARVVRVPYRQVPRRRSHIAHHLRFLGRLPGAVRALRHAATAAGAEVIVALAISSYFPYVSGLAPVAPVVLSLEGGGPNLTRHRRILRNALRRATRIVACAGALARTAVALAPEVAPRLRVIPNGVDPQRFGPGPVFPNPRPYVLTVARLAREKGVDVLLDAFARLSRRDVDLLVAGDGPERGALERRCGALGLGDRVRFLGSIAPNDIPALHRGSVLLACPSRWEGLPLVCLEAMAAGRAVVATAVDGTPDAVFDRRTGLLVPPEDPSALAQALDALLADAPRRAALGAAGRALVHERFTWVAVTARFVAVLEEAAALHTR